MVYIMFIPATIPANDIIHNVNNFGTFVIQCTIHFFHFIHKFKAYFTLQFRVPYSCRINSIIKKIAGFRRAVAKPPYREAGWQAYRSGPMPRHVYFCWEIRTIHYGTARQPQDRITMISHVENLGGPVDRC